MSSISNLSRRALVKWGLVSAGLPALSKVLASPALAQDAGSESGKIGEVGGRAEGELYPGKGLSGGGQLEIRLTQTIYTSDPDALEVAQRMKPYDLDSWVTEWRRVAERNEKEADEFASKGYKVTANEYYLRAANFYRVVDGAGSIGVMSLPQSNWTRSLAHALSRQVGQVYFTRFPLFGFFGS